jgi:hypothetical protein
MSEEVKVTVRAESVCHLDRRRLASHHIPGIDLEGAVVRHHDVCVAVHDESAHIEQTDTIGDSTLETSQ